MESAKAPKGKCEIAPPIPDSKPDEEEEIEIEEFSYKKFAIKKLYLDKIENDLFYKDIEIMSEQAEFLEYCKSNNKIYPDMSRSFFIHLANKRKLGL